MSSFDCLIALAITGEGGNEEQRSTVLDGGGDGGKTSTAAITRRFSSGELESNGNCLPA